MVDFSAKVKAKAFPKQEIYDLISKITGDDKQDIRVYLAMSFAMANRSGELLPYQHYKTTYKRDAEGNLMKIKGERSDYPIIETRTTSWASSGVNVSDIRYKYDANGEVELIVVDKVPVFKTKVLTFERGYIYSWSNPFFKEILDLIEKRKALVTKDNPVVYLFGLPKDKSPERYFWWFKKRVQKELKKYLVGNLVEFKIHSLRSSRATDAAEVSRGDIFYVQSITRHRELKNLQQYVQPVQMEQKIKKYEGGN